MRFAKLHGLGNDFLVLLRETEPDLTTAPRLARDMCERHRGAGADGIVFLWTPAEQDADFESRIFNADGSEAEISGNGTRCAAAFAYFAGLWSKPAISISTAAGVKSGRLVNRKGLIFEFEFDMGTPKLASADIPVRLDPPRDRVVAHHLEAADLHIEVTCLSMGNPHCVVFVSDLGSVDLGSTGPLLESHPFFPERTNVEFVRIDSADSIEIRIWERGAGHTLSSGTGSCASALASAMNGFTGRRVRVKTEGGELLVNWKEDDTVTLTGTAEMVYEGNWLSPLPA